jgi:hypothetical protein
MIGFSRFEVLYDADHDSPATPVRIILRRPQDDGTDEIIRIYMTEDDYLNLAVHVSEIVYFIKGRRSVQDA